jgi:hypothetical protein
VEYFNKMNGDAGYFWDSYNRTNLLWLFDLSWLKDTGLGFGPGTFGL